jgi:AraC-like DNA-binding protein
MKDHAKGRMDLLEEHIRESLDKTTAHSVNSNAFYSYRHANRLFKELKGESIKSYTNKIRLQTSAEYLTYTTNGIFDIALAVGYESTAAFSKAFKKVYGESPSAFRQKNDFNHLLKQITRKKPHYTITYFEESKIHTCKVVIAPDISEDELFESFKTTFGQLNTNANQWTLLWDEDPELCTVAESRYFVKIDTDTILDDENSRRILSLKGRYALFEADALIAFPYTVWHIVVSLVLDIDKRILRKGLYLEWFPVCSLDSSASLIPDKIAVPIQ